MKILFLGELLLVFTLPSVNFGEHEHLTTLMNIYIDRIVSSSRNTITETVCKSATECAAVCSMNERCCVVSFNTQTKTCILDTNCFVELTDSTGGIVMIKENLRGIHVNFHTGGYFETV